MCILICTFVNETSVRIDEDNMIAGLGILLARYKERDVRRIDVVFVKKGDELPDSRKGVK